MFSILIFYDHSLDSTMACLCCSKYQKTAELQLSTRARNLKYIIVDLSPVTDIDASAVHFLMVSFPSCQKL